MKSSLPDNKHPQDTYLFRMLDSAQTIMRYMEGVSQEAFLDDTEKCDAVAMRISAIGEAARHVTKETEALLPSVPFKNIRGMRNRIAHDYDDVDYAVVWEVTQLDIKPLVEAIGKYFASKEAPPPAPAHPARKRQKN